MAFKIVDVHLPDAPDLKSTIDDQHAALTAGRDYYAATGRATLVIDATGNVILRLPATPDPPESEGSEQGPPGPPREAEEKDRERYFRDPGSDILRLGMSGSACGNIKIALNALGYRPWNDNDDNYDEGLAAAVGQFQRDRTHANADGRVGPGTRRLLVRVLDERGFDFAQLARVFEYEIMLSVASEDRHYADAVAERLRASSIRIFYDEYASAELLGKELTAHLYDVSSQRARFFVPFVSARYAKSPWTMHEFSAARERAFLEMGGEYILPVRLDETSIPGLPQTIGYVGISKGVEQICDLLVQKVRGKGLPLTDTQHKSTARHARAMSARPARSIRATWATRTVIALAVLLTLLLLVYMVWDFVRPRIAVDAVHVTGDACHAVFDVRVRNSGFGTANITHAELQLERDSGIQCQVSAIFSSATYHCDFSGQPSCTVPAAHAVLGGESDRFVIEAAEVGRCSNATVVLKYNGERSTTHQFACDKIGRTAPAPPSPLPR